MGYSPKGCKKPDMTEQPILSSSFEIAVSFFLP